MGPIEILLHSGARRADPVRLALSGSGSNAISAIPGGGGQLLVQSQKERHQVDGRHAGRLAKLASFVATQGMRN